DNLGWTLAGKRVLLLGSGGAARGVIQPLLEAGPAELIVSGRTPWNVEKLAIAFKEHGPLTPRTHITLKGDCFDLVLNATSIGHDGQVLRLPPGIVHKDSACYDLNYGKASAPFREWAGAQGVGRVAEGLGMLVEQAAASFALWHGRRPQTAPVIRQLAGQTS
ncbi:MAG TPA: shikimate dehydrogenase, partial [Verrucomicrobiae bacterium]|nr:shikimate dehydrogenase [Verrucomicrobiae bacterium]